MVKLKCWKKDEAGWHPKRGGGWVYYYPKNGFRDRENEIVISTSSTGGSNPKDRVNTGFDTKSQALKFANKYMKEHDKC